MTEDPRCCGSGTCIIDPEGRCWCGQKWDGTKMASPQPILSAPSELGAEGTPDAAARSTTPPGPPALR